MLQLDLNLYIINYHTAGFIIPLQCFIVTHAENLFEVICFSKASEWTSRSHTQKVAICVFWMVASIVMTVMCLWFVVGKVSALLTKLVDMYYLSLYHKCYFINSKS